jgi:hypothetical protein
MSKLQESCCPLQKKGSTGKERLTYYNHVKTNMNPSTENHAVIKNLNHYWLFLKGMRQIFSKPFQVKEKVATFHIAL